jgi:hypothetical protein
MMFMHKSFNPFATLLMVVSVLLAYFCGFFFTYNTFIDEQTAVLKYKPVPVVIFEENPTQAISKLERLLITKYVHDNSIICNEDVEEIINVTFEVSRDPYLLLAIFRKESSYQAVKTGSKTKYGYARGLGQVMWSIHRDSLRNLGINSPRELYNARNNIIASENVLTGIRKRCQTKNLTCILKRYYGARDHHYETTVLKYYKELQQLRLDAYAIYVHQQQRIKRH